ncbi:galactose mutarotase-like protein [Auriculariales sp. MPI-PUGE-AT-0066]|nr:galactose mutarotase-like protein [Auriculariales sp. MPI-PUGE-AT-0066]
MGVLGALRRLLKWIYSLILGAKSATENPFAETIITAPNGKGRATLIGVGATLVELWVPDAKGDLQDVVLGYDDRAQYLDDPAHPVFGRVAGRISNGQFTLDGKSASTIHGGVLGWDRRTWKRIAYSAHSVTYELVDDAFEGFPGRVTVKATYELVDGPELKMSVTAKTTERTPLVISNHSYWNLDGHSTPHATSIHDHLLQIRASRISALGGLYVPTGELASVQGTVHDFTSPRRIGERWSDPALIRDGGVVGYNDNWIYDERKLSDAALTLTSPTSGIKMQMFTNQPSVVAYSAIYLNDVPRKGSHVGEMYKPGTGLAIEQQAHADAINHPEWNVNVVCGPEEEYTWWTNCRFSIAA